MKNILFQYRFFIASIVAILGYLFVFDDYFENHFHKYYYAYFSVVTLVILLSGFILQIRRLAICVCWSLFSPMAASFLGSCAMEVQMLINNGHFSRVTLGQWLLIAPFFGYLLSRLFVVSFALLAFCAIDYCLFRRSP